MRDTLRRWAGTVGVAWAGWTGAAAHGDFVFVRIAQTGPGSAVALDSIDSAAINDGGTVAFAATSRSAAAVYRASLLGGAPVLVSAGFDFAVAPALNDQGAIAFVGGDAGTPLGLFLAGSDSIQLLFAAADLGLDALGQLALANPGPFALGGNEGRLAYWSAALNLLDPPLAQCIEVLALDTMTIDTVACAGAPNLTTAPAVNDAGLTAWLAADFPAPGAAELSIWTHDGIAAASTGFTVALDAGGQLSPPALDGTGRIAVFARSDTLAAGIYRVEPGSAAPPQGDCVWGLAGPHRLLVPLECGGTLRPSPGTRPFLADDGRVSFLARDVAAPGGEVEGIFTLHQGEIEAVVRVGDAFAGSTLVGSLQLLDLNDRGHHLIRGLLANTRTALVVAIPAGGG
jgi:hypothetical protein